MLHKKPIIALSLGDPAGIGPEIVAALSYDEALLQRANIICFGDKNALYAGYEAKRLLPRFVTDSKEGYLSLQEVTRLPTLNFGEKNTGAGSAQLRYFDEAIRAVQRREAHAICTAPITKALVDEEAGPFSGHTGYLAKKANGRAVMMLASDELRVVLATEHIPLKEVASTLRIEDLQKVIAVTAQGLIQDFGISCPRIGVAALNPHAGEGGLLGKEEATVIGPAVQAARASLRDSAQILDPAPADSLFTAAARARYDVVICLYHDQGLIPLKTLSARSAVNVTLGLDLIRTSPDHGTAYDIAGKGLADASSLIKAAHLAADISLRRTTF